MQPLCRPRALCKPRAVPLFDPEPQRSSVPDTIRSAIARDALDGREPGGIPVDVATTLQPSSE